MELIQTEYKEQCAVIRWRDLMVRNGEPRLALLHGDSSGVRVSIGCAVKMEKHGAIKGWPDLFLPIVTEERVGVGNVRVLSGLFIELKRRKGGKVSPEQEEIHNLLRDQGYKVEVCKGANAAIRVIQEYLGGNNGN